MFKINTRELINVLSLQCDGTDYTEIEAYIIKEVISSGAKCYRDTYKNIYAIKGTGDLYPCIVSHTDSVHKIYKEYKVFQNKDILFAYSNSEERQVGISGDDKTGVYICLQALKDLNTLKVVFFRDEETGTRGSGACNMSFFDDCKFVLQCDREGNNALSKCAAGVDLNDSDFQDMVKPYLKKYNYTFAYTSITDVMKLKSRKLNIAATNIECGYYESHTSREYVNIRDVNRAYSLVLDIINNSENRKYLHTYTPKESNIVRYSSMNSHYDYGNYSDKDENILNTYSLVKDLSGLYYTFVNKNETVFIESQTGKYYFYNQIKDEFYSYSGFGTKITYHTLKMCNLLYKKLKLYNLCIKENMVFNNLNRKWVIEKDAIYSTTLGTYIHKNDDKKTYTY